MSRPAFSAAVSQSTAASALHQYACLRCRSRRVKCDKSISGCANCAGHGAQCVYSARRPRKPKTISPDRAARKPLLPASGSPVSSTSICRANGSNTPGSADSADKASEPSDDDEEADAIMPKELRDAAFQVKNGTANASGGTLLMGPQGESRYFNNDKTKQVAYFETILSIDRIKHHESKPVSPSPASTNRNDDLNPSSLLTISRGQRDLSSYAPPPEIMHLLWDYYCRNVDMMVKCLYKPEVDDLITRASKCLDPIDYSSEGPLLFAIWFAVATVMSPEDARQLHGEEKQALTRKYRYALEHAFAEAEWITTQNIRVLQGLTIYLMFCPYNLRSSWMLSGITLGLAQAMGLHADSASYSLGVIDTEVRRRVWWLLVQLDVRISENCGLEPHVPLVVNTGLPLHINDSDLTSAGGKPITPRTEFTEMTMTLIKLEMGKTNLQRQRTTDDLEKQRVLREQVQRYEQIWLLYFSTDSEMHRLCYLGTQFLIVRLRAIAHDLVLSSAKQDESLDEEMIVNNARLLEISLQLPFKSRRYGWFFRCKHSQWHALAYLLFQMCKHTEGPVVDRTWEVLDSTFSHLEAVDYTHHVNRKVIKTLWQPLLRLHERARSARKQGLQSRLASVSRETSSTTNTSSEDQHSPPDADASLQDGLMGDPFLGSMEEFDMEVNWDQIDEWVQKFQNGLQEQYTDQKDQEMMGAMSWW